MLVAKGFLILSDVVKKKYHQIGALSSRIDPLFELSYTSLKKPTPIPYSLLAISIAFLSLRQ